MVNLFKDYVAMSENTATRSWNGSVLELLKQFNIDMINPKPKTIIPNLNDAIKHIVKGIN